MTYYLMVWVVSAVSFSSGGYNRTEYHEWRNLGEFNGEATCYKAATSLGYRDRSNVRCVYAGKDS